MANVDQAPICNAMVMQLQSALAERPARRPPMVQAVLLSRHGEVTPPGYVRRLVKSGAAGGLPS